jgi:hypothetical protein
MGVADLRLRPPPRGGETARPRQVGSGGPDEGIDVVEDLATVIRFRGRRGFDQVNSLLLEGRPVSFAGLGEPANDHDYARRRQQIIRMIHAETHVEAA